MTAQNHTTDNTAASHIIYSLGITRYLQIYPMYALRPLSTRTMYALRGLSERIYAVTSTPQRTLAHNNAHKTDIILILIYFI